MTHCERHTFSGGTTLEDISYTLNAVGIRTSMTDLSGTTDWTYDDLYRLTDMESPNSDDVSYGYDDVGNRTSLTINGTTTTNWPPGVHLSTKPGQAQSESRS